MTEVTRGGGAGGLGEGGCVEHPASSVEIVAISMTAESAPRESRANPTPISMRPSATTAILREQIILCLWARMKRAIHRREAMHEWL